MCLVCGVLNTVANIVFAQLLVCCGNHDFFSIFVLWLWKIRGSKSQSKQTRRTLANSLAPNSAQAHFCSLQIQNLWFFFVFFIKIIPQFDCVENLIAQKIIRSLNIIKPLANSGYIQLRLLCGKVRFFFYLRFVVVESKAFQ